MQAYINVNIGPQGGKSDWIHALIAIIAGAAALIWPNYLYYIVGGFLIAIGLLFAFLQFSSIISAGAVLSGGVIILYPSLIPYGFAFFLLVLGLSLLMSGGFSILGIISLLLAVWLISNPGSIAILIGIFMLFYGLNHLIKIFQRMGNSDQLKK